MLAIQFLTIIPVWVRGEVTERQVGQSAIFFPLVGALQGLLAFFAVFALFQVFDAELLAGIIVLLLILINGAFHLDGLADTFDGIAVKSSGDRETDRVKRLTVMKDGSTGAIGVTAIVLAILLKYLFIRSVILTYYPVHVAYILFLMPLFSKWAMVPALLHGRPARQEGLGKIFITETGLSTLLLSSFLLVLIFFAATQPLSFLTLWDGIRFLLLTGLSLYAFGLAWSRFCGWRFGGHTGDTLGALGEMADILFLGIASMWL